VTFVDLSDLQHPRYQHVLLVAPVRRDDGAIDVLPVRIHAGGLAWQGPVLHVAGTARGLFSFHPRRHRRRGSERLGPSRPAV
jgi:hypothetical protein